MTNPENTPEEQPPTLSPSVSLDEDELAEDPLEEGLEPPTEWSAEARRRPTSKQEREGETVDERLSEERGEPESVEPTPLAETRMRDLDDSVDEIATEQRADTELPPP
jgi:hypothetical protein